MLRFYFQFYLFIRRHIILSSLYLVNLVDQFLKKGKISNCFYTVKFKKGGQVRLYSAPHNIYYYLHLDVTLSGTVAKTH